MTRTRRANEDKPSVETADSRRQLKDTKLSLQGRTKLERPKKSGRLSAVDHDFPAAMATTTPYTPSAVAVKTEEASRGMGGAVGGEGGTNGVIDTTTKKTTRRRSPRGKGSAAVVVDVCAAAATATTDAAVACAVEPAADGLQMPTTPVGGNARVGKKVAPVVAATAAYQPSVVFVPVPRDNLAKVTTDDEPPASA